MVMLLARALHTVFTLPPPCQEIADLVGAAPMAHAAMRGAPEAPPPQVLNTLSRVIEDFDRARSRLDNPGA